MARHYSTRDFFRQMPNALLARYFRERGLFGDLDFAAMKETKPDELFTVWLDVPDRQRNQMDAEFQEIFELSCEKGFRAILDEAEWTLTAAGLPCFNPHSFRNTLVQPGQRRCRTAEEFTAWSQNLGHEGVLTTFYSYGVVGTGRQGEIIHSLCTSQPVEAANVAAIAEAVFRRFERSGGAR